MNEDRLEGNWKMLKGKVREQWGKLTDDEIDEADGKWDHLSGLIQNKYGRARDAVEKEIALFRQQQDDASRARQDRDEVLKPM